MTVPAIPKGYHSVTPYLIVRGAVSAINFYERAFAAQELYRLEMPGGKIGHAEIQIGDSRLMLADEFPERDVLGPQSVGGTTVGLLLYLEDVDATFERALEAGATAERRVEDQFYGDRTGTILDPFGHRWTLATHKEEVSPEEMKKRMSAQKPD